ncbi:MAG: hypothetical protein LBU32_17500 [Clostridiales bacterium]|jgi:hypothetical protein|nr:hypothetical protein [Clostridiales bacterium]
MSEPSHGPGLNPLRSGHEAVAAWLGRQKSADAIVSVSPTQMRGGCGSFNVSAENRERQNSSTEDPPWRQWWKRKNASGKGNATKRK